MQYENQEKKCSLPKKETVFLGLYYMTSFGLTLLLPNLIASSIATTKVQSFCSTHNATCSQYHNRYDEAEKLVHNVYTGTVSRSVAFSLVGSISTVVYFFVFYQIFLALKKCCVSVNTEEEAEKEMLIEQTSTSSYCCNLFKRAKDDIVNTENGVLELIAMSLGLGGSNALIVWVNTISTTLSICSHPTPDSQICQSTFPEISKEQLEQIRQLLQGLYNNMMGWGITLGCGISIFMAIVTIVFLASVRRCMQSNDEERERAAIINRFDDEDELGLVL